MELQSCCNFQSRLGNPQKLWMTATHSRAGFLTHRGRASAPDTTNPTRPTRCRLTGSTLHQDQDGETGLPGRAAFSWARFDPRLAPLLTRAAACRPGPGGPRAGSRRAQEGAGGVLPEPRGLGPGSSEGRGGAGRASRGCRTRNYSTQQPVRGREACRENWEPASSQTRWPLPRPGPR